MDPVTNLVSIPQVGAGATTAVDDVAGPGYRRISELISDGTIGRFMNKPFVKPVAIGAAALAIFGFIYRRKRKDRTKEEMEGPPLLPGGSAYESAYPGNTLNVPIKERYDEFWAKWRYI
jgi:hypothetical protein